MLWLARLISELAKHRVLYFLLIISLDVLHKENYSSLREPQTVPTFQMAVNKVVGLIYWNFYDAGKEFKSS